VERAYLRPLTLLLALPLAASVPGYRQALPGFRYSFPRDHFDHPEYRTEWWYYTGNVRAAGGRRYGFELVFFRQGQNREPRPTRRHGRSTISTTNG
jgi:predicted secreted hydrolase